MTKLLLSKAPNGSLIPMDQATVDYIAKLKVGAAIHGNFSRIRNIMFHRKFFALIGVGYDAWNPKVEYKGEIIQKNYEAFREEVTILAGFKYSVATIDGYCGWKAKSISFGSMEQDEFEKLYSAVIDVILSRILTRYTRDDLDTVVDNILRFS